MTNVRSTGTPRLPAGFEAPARKNLLELFVVSFVALFLELACIRWFSSTVVLLTFFTNLVLMACFLGLSVGCLAARQRRDYLQATLPLGLLAIGLAIGLLWSYTRLSNVVIDMGSQTRPEQVYFGTDFRRRDLAALAIPLEVVAAVFFTLISAIFLGIGQAMGRALDRVPDRARAYALNLAGSLAGIVAFGGLSLLQTPPPVWFGIGFGLIVVLVPGTAGRWVAGISAALSVAVLSLSDDLADPAGSAAATIWSPYYKVRYNEQNQKIYVNNILHQIMTDVSHEGYQYHVPHLLNRHAGGPPFQDVLVIGAGSGNDVAAALARDAGSVDAVEIDPALYEIGRRHHPNRPAADPRVTSHIDDGRAFVRSTSRKYDLIIYALVDSLVLHSGYASIRLESFLFTDQAFRDLRDHLKPGGLLVLYNLYRQGWVVGRLASLARDAFGAEPIVLSLPYQETIRAGDSQGSRMTFLLAAGEESSAFRAIRDRFESDQYFWVHPTVPFLDRRAGYGSTWPAAPGNPSDGWTKLGPARVETDGIGPLPTDDFPFLYLRKARIPGLNLRGMALVAIISMIFLLRFAPVRTTRPNGRMFFLGAGFMLLETKGVVHLALLFGSTWMVNSIVFAAILVMAMLSNLLVMRFRPRRLWPSYALLIGSLLLNLAIPMTSFLNLPGAARVVVSCLVVFVPIFFAGIIFATTFRDSSRPDLDFGSNIGGAILGGLSENLSLVVGFNNLLVLAAGYYLLSAALTRRPG